jgi:hypothetical protein
MFRKWRMAAGATVLALAAFGVTAAVAVPPSAITATVKPAKMDPFTGRMTTQYATLDGTTYYEIVAEGTSKYCISTNGGGSGTDLVLEGCSTSTSSDLWAAAAWGGTNWNGDEYVFNKANNNLCIDDAGGDNNIRLPVETCAEVGGQAWQTNSTNPGEGGACIWMNAIGIVNGTQIEDITDDNGDLGDGDWVIALKDTGYPWASDQTWGGLVAGSCAGG